MQIKASVVICTHNPRPDYLRRTIDALREQTLPMEQWEFLLIDNASKAQLKDFWDLSWQPWGKHVREDEVGLTAARLRGIKESSGNLIIFVDDDNILAPAFLEQAIAIHGRHPFLGVFGAGELAPEFEVPPPPEIVPFLSLLALRTVTQERWSNEIGDGSCIPWGAGLCVTRRVAIVYPELVAKLNMTAILDRRGKQLFSGGDDMFSWAAVGTGQAFGIFPELRIKHLISAGRLDKDYFVRLMGDHAFSHAVLNFLLAESRLPRIRLERYVRLIFHGIRNGHFSMRCQWARLKAEKRAAHFIAENKLQPVEIVFKP